MPTPHSFPTAHHHSQQARRDFSGADMAVLTSLLEAANLCSFTSNTDVDTKFAEWLAKVDSALDVVAPLIVPSTKRHRLNLRRKCPFVTTELKDMIRCRKTAFRAYQRGGPTAATNFATFRRLRTQCNNMYRRLRNLHYESVCQEYRCRPRRLWATINYVTKRKPVTSSVLAASTSLNDHFHHIVHDPECSYHLPHGPAMQGALTSLVDVTEQDVEYRLFTLKPGTAPGPDGLLPGFLKTMAAILAPSLARIFSSSLCNGIFPSALRYANVTPILKSTRSDAFSPTSYRPISLTSILAKVLESIVLDQLASHMDPNDYLHDYQFGFRPHRSVHLLLTLVIHDWTLARDKGLSTAVAFVDLSKAFDRVQHQQLLTSLFDIGVSGTALEWFASYLGQRFQRVIVNGELTPFLPVSSGVPQGSKLGPTLFNILVRHLPAHTNQLRTKLLSFADDKTLYASRPTAAEAAATVSSALASLTSHLQELGMVINEDKTVVMFIKPRSSPDSQHTICVNGRSLTEVSSTRCLGIIIDNRLSRFLTNVTSLLLRYHVKLVLYVDLFVSYLLKLGGSMYCV